MIGMSANFPSDHAIFYVDGFTLYEGRDRCGTGTDMERVHMGVIRYQTVIAVDVRPPARWRKIAART